MSESAFRVGLIGYGLSGATFHAPLVAATPGLVLVSVVTRDPARRAQATRDHPGIQLFDRSSDLFERAERPDLVIIATPNATHVSLASAAIESGCAVVIDKPMAPTVKEARALIEKASRRDVLLTVFQNRRWDGDFLTVRRLLQENALGSVFRFESRFERWRPDVRASAWRERPQLEEAGGLLYDLGSHLIDQVIVLFGHPTRVYAELERRRMGALVDDDSFVALAHEGGARSHLWMSNVVAVRGPRMRVFGLAGTYEKHGFDPQEELLAAGKVPGGPGWGGEPPDRWGVLATGAEARRIETEPGAYQDFYAGLVGALRAGGPRPVDAMDSVRVLEVIEAAQYSAATGSTIVIPARDL